MASHNVNKALVDIRSSINIMFYDYFTKLDLEDMDLVPAPYPITGFIGYVIYPNGYGFR